MTRIGFVAAVFVGVVMGTLSTAKALERRADVWMSEADIRREMVGHAMKGYYRDGVRWVDDYSRDGAIAYHDDRNTWTGKWSFQGNVFCTFYEGGSIGGCYLVRQLSANCFDFIVVPDDWRGPDLAPGTPASWLARGWRGEEASTCEEPPIA
jgi:hypothetical protein